MRGCRASGAPSSQEAERLVWDFRLLSWGGEFAHPSPAPAATGKGSEGKGEKELAVPLPTLYFSLQNLPWKESGPVPKSRAAEG